MFHLFCETTYQIFVNPSSHTHLLHLSGSSNNETSISISLIYLLTKFHIILYNSIDIEIILSIRIIFYKKFVNELLLIKIVGVCIRSNK